MTAASAPASDAKDRLEETIDEKAAWQKMMHLKRRVWIQTIILAALGSILAAILPFSQPIPLYYAIMPDKRTEAMIGLSMPNMTSRAILSWATTSITEIMTMGFGDMDVRLPRQKVRFTPDGWKAFQQSFDRAKIGETFKQSQLVLTTAPSNTPVIVARGINRDNVYQWIVQMPVIMTYATNNEVTRKKKSIVSLTIVRVPAEDNAAGIAIDGWQFLM
jgi:intracellular multiplication protein IcmL